MLWNVSFFLSKRGRGCVFDFELEEGLLFSVVGVAHDGMHFFVELVRDRVGTNPLVSLDLLQLQSTTSMILQQAL